MSDYVYGEIENKATGSTNQIELTKKMAIQQLVPLPPMNEQTEIVAKVDNLFSLLNTLEKNLEEKNSIQNELQKSLIAEFKIG